MIINDIPNMIPNITIIMISLTQWSGITKYQNPKAEPYNIMVLPKAIYPRIRPPLLT